MTAWRHKIILDCGAANGKLHKLNETINQTQGMHARRRLPPLNGLRVFEVAARHMSFTRAADELCVTNAAVSHQVKQLEEFLGLKLFDRHNNQLLLTGAGENYLPRIREAFRSVQQATELLLSDTARPLRIGVPPALGSKWLVPRLFRFLNANPDLRVEVITEPELQSLDSLDLLIAERQSAERGTVTERFATTGFLPVCSPAVAAELDGLPSLLEHNLLHDRSAQRLAHVPTWRQWLEEVGLSENQARRSMGLSDTQLALQAAIDGQGIALGQQLLVEYDLAAGRLVSPFRTEVSLRLSYYLMYRDGLLEQEGPAALRQWLMDEARPNTPDS
ncbi:LysR substrate-binding domain-containing protein [Niveibacterium microcysteis]|uniref:LysR family transcriptional regulator n=1 Tax=Niveibacterium microcysteis TaxID=2811415 RepID=A0ABX7M9T6_9RHOO|nr:LysR substrate-binding domain-containing protein [Niveibacterium microcysteis]QSI78487.1 LysR family transcriptional regulator [Niveibacterium microcysteis]